MENDKQIKKAIMDEALKPPKKGSIPQLWNQQNKKRKWDEAMNKRNEEKAECQTMPFQRKLP